MSEFRACDDDLKCEVHLEGQKLLADVLDYLERLPVHPMTAQVVKRVRAHLEDPNVELVRQRDAMLTSTRQAEILARQGSEGASRYKPAGLPVLLLRVVGNAAHIISPAIKAQRKTSAGRVLVEQIAKELAAGVSIPLAELERQD